MKKTIITLSALFIMTSLSVSAQDQDGDKKQEPKKEKSGTSGGGTRMAINEKGLPGHKKETGSTHKSSGTSTVATSPPAEKKSEDPK